MGKLRIPRHVRGTTLAFDSMGRPKVIHSHRGAHEMENIRKHRTSSMLKLLQSMSHFFRFIFCLTPAMHRGFTSGVGHSP